MKAIEFSLKVAQKAAEAINDNPYFDDKLNQTYSNVFEINEEFESDQEEIIAELGYQLESWGIEKDEYEIN